jgi:hypothetical protein
MIIELNKRLNNTFFPVNRYLAKANPAIEVKVIYSTVTMDERNKLLKKFLQTLSLSKRIWYCVSVNGSGKNIGGKTLAFPSNINDAPIIQINGMSVSIDEIIKKLYISTFFIIPYSSEF